MEIAESLGIPYPPWKGQAVVRALYFTTYPDVDRGYCLTTTCNDSRCVSVSHVRLGVINPKRGVVASRLPSVEALV